MEKVMYLFISRFAIEGRRVLLRVTAITLLWFSCSVAYGFEIEPLTYVTSGGNLILRHTSEAAAERFTITMGSLVIIDTSDWWGVAIREVVPESPPHRIFILELATGGTACDGYNQVLEIVSSNKWLLSKVFGNCNNPSISVHGQRIDFRFPRTSADNGEHWRYEREQLSLIHHRD
jgi:hypothetical protein